MDLAAEAREVGEMLRSRAEAKGLALDLDVPGNFSLIGKQVWVQGWRIDVGPVGNPVLSNAECFTVLPPLGLLCIEPNC